MSKKDKPIIERVEKLPKSMRERITTYDDIVKDIENKEKGYYKVTLAGKKPLALHAALAKRIKDKRDTFKLHMRNKEVYLERL